MSQPTDAPEERDGIRMEAVAADNARIYQAARDQHFHYQDELSSVRRVTGTDKSVCPYPGLAPFSTAEAEWFFGRDRLTADLLSLLTELNGRGGPLMVVAPSGAGKSSLLQAGLLPAIRRGALPVAGSADWPQMAFTPTAHPIHAAATAIAALGGEFAAMLPAAEPCSDDLTAAVDAGLAARPDAGPGGAKVIIVVDQLEELFTLGAGEPARREFIEWLWRLSRRGDGADGSAASAALVTCGVRADFYAACADYPQLRTALQSSQVFVGPMSQAELRQAIRFPARAAGLEIEDGLVELLLRDLGGDQDAETAPGLDDYDYEAGRLPFLAHALQATWQQRSSGHVLTVDGYQATGGISRAIAITAERCFSRLDADAQDDARAVFLRLVRISDRGDDVCVCCAAAVKRVRGPGRRRVRPGNRGRYLPEQLRRLHVRATQRPRLQAAPNPGYDHGLARHGAESLVDAADRIVFKRVCRGIQPRQSLAGGRRRRRHPTLGYLKRGGPGAPWRTADAHWDRGAVLDGFRSRREPAGRRGR